jgi:hypothetical protein
MRSDVNSAYTYFANTILPKIVGPTKWRGQVTKRTISQIATPTDEAFGLLLLENSWENWKEAQRLVHEDNSKSGANKMWPKLGKRQSAVFLRWSVNTGSPPQAL